MAPEDRPFRNLSTSGITARTTICTTMSTDLMTWEEAKNFAPRLKEVGKKQSSNWKTGWFAINCNHPVFFAYAWQLNAMMEAWKKRLFSFSRIKTSKRRTRAEVWFLSTCPSETEARDTESRQNPPKLKKYSTRLPSPKRCGRRLRANLRNRCFARKPVLACRLSRRCQALHFFNQLFK